VAEKVAASGLCAFSTVGVLQQLCINPCDGLTPKQEEQIRAAGYDIGSILDEGGIAAERLHDALFLTPEIARTTIGRNYERVAGSIKSCNRAVQELPPASRIVDLGGACGIICFEAAKIRPDCSFQIADRSQNALLIGCEWARNLDLLNVSHKRLSFADPDLGVVLGEDNELVVIEYVFEVGGDWENEDQAINDFTPGLTAASRILSSSGVVQVRFGDSSEAGLAGLIRAAYRANLLITSLSVEREGCTLVFKSEDHGDRSEDSEVFNAMDAFASQMWL